jgi:hypothetical protein
VVNWGVDSGVTSNVGLAHPLRIIVLGLRTSAAARLTGLAYKISSAALCPGEQASGWGATALVMILGDVVDGVFRSCRRAEERKSDESRTLALEAPVQRFGPASRAQLVVSRTRWWGCPPVELGIGDKTCPIPQFVQPASIRQAIPLPCCILPCLAHLV